METVIQECNTPEDCCQEASNAMYQQPLSRQLCYKSIKSLHIYSTYLHQQSCENLQYHVSLDVLLFCTITFLHLLSRINETEGNPQENDSHHSLGHIMGKKGLKTHHNNR